MVKITRVAVVIATQYGQTRKIGRHLQARLSDAGCEVDFYEPKADSQPHSVPIKSYDLIVIGAPVYAGKFSGSLIEWARTHANELASVHTAFFSVSLNAADTRPQAREEDRRLISEFLKATKLQPRCTASLIGTVHYRKYNFLTRWLLRNICRKAGGPTDTSRDHELTDWKAVDVFAERLAALD